MKITLLLACLLYGMSVHAATEGETAPEFTLPVIGAPASEISLTSLRGKVVYLDFWASWCAPCRVSFPEIIELKEDLGEQDFEVVAISVDERIEDAGRFLRRYKTPYPVLHDPEGKFASSYKLPGMPTSFVIDRNGVIRLVHSGFKPGDMATIRQEINKLLDNKK